MSIHFGRFADKNGAPVYPEIRKLFFHAQEMVIKISRMSPEELRAKFDVTAEDDFEALRAVLAQIALKNPEEIIAKFDALVGVESKIHDGWVYVLPNKEHDGKGFAFLNFGDAVEYLNQETGTWDVAEHFNNKYLEADGMAKIQLIRNDDNATVLVDPWLVRKPIRR